MASVLQIMRHIQILEGLQSWEAGRKVNDVVVWELQGLEGCVVNEYLGMKVCDAVVRKIQLLQWKY